MPYLPETMESLFQQSSPDFNILAIVDGADDSSLDYLLSIRDERLRVLQQRRHGITFTLNRMLRECRTRWLVRQDADDLATPNRIAVVQDAIQRNSSAGMFYSEAAYYPRHRSVGLYRCTRGTPEQIRAVAQSGYIPAICHPSAVLHVEKVLALGGYRAGIQCEDADLWWRMALAHDVHFIPEILLLFRQNVSSLTSRNLEQQALHGLYVQYLLLSKLENRRPEPLSVVEPQLRELLAQGPLRAKEKLRLCNMHLGGRRYAAAFGALMASLSASPAYLFQRMRDEYFPSSNISNGVEPKQFQQRENIFWPNHVSA